MAQFHAYENTHAASREAYPYLLDIQSDLLAGLRTTVVVPLSPTELAGPAAIDRLSPVLEIGGQHFVALLAQAAGIERRHLGQQMADLTACRDAVIAALDFLISGI